MSEGDIPDVPILSFNECLIETITVGEFSFRGDELRNIELPVKGFPAWKIFYDQGSGTRVMIAAGVPILIDGAVIHKAVVEEEEEPSADE